MDDESDPEQDYVNDSEAHQPSSSSAMSSTLTHPHNGYNSSNSNGRPANRALTRSNDKLYVGDKILLANKRSGKVTSLGPKQEKEGIWVRVVMDNVHMNSDKMFDNDSRNAKNKTIWVPIQRVDRIISHAKRFDLTIGDRVIERKKGIAGTIKYVGPTHFDKGVWFGVALDAPKGKNNGTVRKKFYFQSEANHGVMLPYKRLEHESKRKPRRSQSQNFEKEDNNVRHRNGHQGQQSRNHFKTTSDGVVNGQYLTQQLQLDHLIDPADHEQRASSNHKQSSTSSSSSQQAPAVNHQAAQHMDYDDEDHIETEMNGHSNGNAHDDTNNNNDVDGDEYNEYMDDINDTLNGHATNNNKTPSSDSDDQMFSIGMKSAPSQSPRKKTKLAPKEKHPFLGWKKLVNGSAPVVPLSDNEDEKLQSQSPEPTPTYQLDEDEPTRKVLVRYYNEIKQFSGIEKELYDSNLPSITEVNKEQRENIFVQKLYLCQAKCDFFDQRDEMIELIEKKERMLLELSEFIARHVWFKESLYEKCLDTVSNNLFRALPYQDRPPALSFFNDEVFDKDTNFEDPAWRHLKLVYDLTWRVINTPQVTAAMMEKHMTGKFLGNLIELFASEDHRERAYLMMILHKIYGRCLKLRPYIIQIMSGYFYRMIYADEFQHVNGIIELLQIICAIIPGLTVPVKDSWQSFVRNILVPLHKCRGLKKFWEQLTQCCVNYVAKDEDGGAVILGGLLKFWPQQSPQKEEIFIMEVVNIINVLITHQHGFSYENYKEVLVSAANKLTQCMLSTRQPVAERAIAAWKEQSMQRLVDYDRKAFLPKLCEAFYRNREHPNAALKQSSTAVEKIYRSKDSAYWRKMQQYLAKKDKKETAIAKAIQDAQIKNKDPYEIVKAKHAKDVSKHKRPKPLTAAERSAKRQHFWKKIEKTAQVNQHKFKHKHRNQLHNNYSNSSSDLEPPNLST